MKKNFALILVLAMILAIFGGCGTTAASTSDAAAASDSEAAESTVEAADEEEAEAPAEAADEEETSSAQEEVLPKNYASEEHKEYTMWMGLSQFAASYVETPETELTILREVADRLNVSFSITAMNPESLDTTFSLMIAGGDYCDIISEMGYYDLGIEDAIDNDIIRDVYDLVEEYAPNYWAQLTSHISSYMKMTTESGYMGSLCVFLTDDSAGTEQWGYITNGAWYDEFGMDIATTIDEFYDYLSMAYETYGAQFSIDEAGMEAGILTAYNIAAGMYVVDGEVRYGYVQDEMKDYINLMGKWYSEGLLETGFYNGTTDTGAQLAGTANGTFSAWGGTAEVSKNVYSFDEEGHTSVVAGTPYLKMDADSEIHTMNSVSYIHDQGTYAWSFRADLPDEDVITLLNVVEYLFTDEGYLLFNFGVEGKGLAYDENGEPMFSELITNNPDLQYNVTSYLYASQNGTTYIPGILDLRKGYYSFTDDQWQALDAFMNAGDSEYTLPAAVSLNTAESEQYYAYSTDVETYIESTTVQWIIDGGVSDADWDTFVSTLYSMNVEEMIGAYQSAYDRYFEEYERAEAAIGA